MLYAIFFCEFLIMPNICTKFALNTDERLFILITERAYV